MSGVLIMAGGTGGHIYPGLAVAEELRQRGVEVSWLGAHGAMEADIVPPTGIAFFAVSARRLRGQSLVQRLVAPIHLARAVWRAAAIMRRVRPRCVLSMGGFAAAPGGVAARIHRIPVLVHEQNSVAGMTNRLLARFAHKVLTAFPSAFSDHPRVELVGNPVRTAISSLPERKPRSAGTPLRVLVLGGSLGAAGINRVVPGALAQMPEHERPTVRHQVGKSHLEAVEAEYRRLTVAADISGFIDDMAEAYAWADVVICRAGALTCAELCSAGLGSMLIPYPYAVDDHQTRNAQYLVSAGAAVLVAEADLNTDLVATTFSEWARAPGALVTMGKAARTLARPAAAETVAARCMEVSG